MMNASEAFKKGRWRLTVDLSHNDSIRAFTESDIAQIIEQAQREVLEDVKPVLDALDSSQDPPARGNAGTRKAFLAKWGRALLSDSEREGNSTAAMGEKI